MSGLSGLTNAYRSVLSATGSLEILGASRWDVTNLFSCAHFLSDKCGETGILCLDNGLPVHDCDLVTRDGGDNWLRNIIHSGGIFRRLSLRKRDLAHQSCRSSGNRGDPYPILQKFSP